MCLSSQDQYKTSLQDLIDILRSTLGRAEFKHVLSAASGSAGESWCGSPSEASAPLRKGLGGRDPLWVPIPRVHSFNTHVSTHVCTHSIHTCTHVCIHSFLYAATALTVCWAPLRISAQDGKHPCLMKLMFCWGRQTINNKIKTFLKI